MSPWREFIIYHRLYKTTIILGLLESPDADADIVIPLPSRSFKITFSYALTFHPTLIHPGIHSIQFVKCVCPLHLPLLLCGYLYL